MDESDSACIGPVSLESLSEERNIHQRFSFHTSPSSDQSRFIHGKESKLLAKDTMAEKKDGNIMELILPICFVSLQMMRMFADSRIRSAD